MSVSKRGGSFHYRFLFKGQNYNGVCKSCVNLNDAKAFEKNIRDKVEVEFNAFEEEKNNIRKNKTVRALVDNYRYELSGGEPIKLVDAFPLAQAKPSRRNAGAYSVRAKQRYWNDFTLFMAEVYPEVINLADIRKPQIESYVRYLIDNGRFDNSVSFRIGRGATKKKRNKVATYTPSKKLLSAKTIHDIIGACSNTFNKLLEDSGALYNPFERVVTPAKDTTKREIFTRAELLLIKQGLKSDEFCRPLFTVAAATGLTEGDICTLKWSEYDPDTHCLYRVRRKTGVEMIIPLINGLEEYLNRQPKTSEYIFPLHANMYLNNSCGVSYRVKSFLDRLGIVNVKTFENRPSISIKDCHSMRHVFCYYAGQSGLPLATVQSIVGHMTPEMTKHYMSHTTIEDRRMAIGKIPEFLDFNN